MFNDKQITTIEELIAEAEAHDYPYKIDQVKAAFEFADKTHTDDKRKSGNPIIWHCLTVAAYCIRLSLDTTSVISALVHETLEKEKTTVDVIDKKFGTDVAFIVDGLTNLKSQTRVFETHNEDPQNFRHLILNGTEDIRVLIIRLANKVHNLQSWDALTPERRLNQATKTKLVYAPLCEYLGLGQFLEIFERKLFETLQPREFKTVTEVISQMKSEKGSLLDAAAEELSTKLKYARVNVEEMSYRTKNPLSAFRKTQRKHMQPGEELTHEHVRMLRDVLGIRIIVKEVAECYMTLGILHGDYEYEEEEFDDYILKPKESGYKCIHTVIEYEGQPIEIQVRTAEMHDYNEFGPASHIAYKLGKSKDAQDTTWTRDLVEWQNQEHVEKDKYKVKAFSDSIFVFTPKGEIIRLEKSATPIDFAFRVHTDVGYRYQGAKVNGTMRAISWPLRTGDVVEVMTSSKETVNWGWLDVAKTTAAKSKIRKKLREHAELQAKADLKR